MAATCEISNVFSNYFSTMYSSEDPTLASVPAAATFGADDLVLALGSPQMPLEGPGGSQAAVGCLRKGRRASKSLWTNGGQAGRAAGVSCKQLACWGLGAGNGCEQCFLPQPGWVLGEAPQWAPEGG